MTRTARVLSLAALALLAGCDGGQPFDQGACPPVVLPALRVQVVDAATGASLVTGATGWWVSGEHAGELEDFEVPSGYLVALGPAGRYSVVVQHPGYALWGRDDIRVSADECGPRTVIVRAELQR